MLLDLLNKFEIEVITSEGTETLTGTFRDLTKKESKEFQSKNEALNKKQKDIMSSYAQYKNTEELIAIEKEIGNWEEVKKLTLKKQKLNDAANKYDNIEEEAEELIKQRFKLCLNSPDADKIYQYAEMVGYKKMLETISKAVVEGKEKK